MSIGTKLMIAFIYLYVVKSSSTFFIFGGYLIDREVNHNWVLPLFL